MVERDLAAWIRKEHEQVEELSDRLQERVAVVPRVGTDSWIHETLDRFEHFRAHLQKHMALEEQEGYMADVVDRRPTLSGKVERLEQEHRDLIQILDDLHSLGDELRPERRLLIRDFCNRVQALIAYVDHHEDDENDLITFVYCEDIGSKD